MALITRLSRLFEADFHAVLDRIEEPDLQLKQAVREMQFALDQDQQRLKLLQHEAGQLRKAAAETRDGIKGFDEELDICLGANEDDLARDLVRRKLAAERRLQALQQQSASVDSQRDSLAREIDDQSRQLDSMKQKLELLVGDDNPLAGTACGHGDAIRSEEIEIALLREKERRAKS
ncbi:MAG: PspA/IM30 family protein [Gammaproteobacteria bacterium]|nr:PspA/IM30 family protein [Gammaproteobacteria bacterium]MDH3535453.1 PspA/IM30 family protein [Gammaproteobacteria bacterium]